MGEVWEKEGIFRLLPRKKSSRGRKATVNSKILSGLILCESTWPDPKFCRKLDEDQFLEEENINLKWEPYRNEYTGGEKKLLLAKCI